MLPKAQHLVLQQHAELRIDGAEGLVHDEDLRLDGQRACDRHSLAHSPRQLVRVGALETVQAQRMEPPRDTLAALGGRHAGDLEAEADVPLDIFPRIDPVVLEHHRDRGSGGAAGQPDAQATAGRLGESGDDPEQRRLAATRGPDDAHELTVVQLEIDRPDGAHEPAAFGGEFALEGARLDHCGGRPLRLGNHRRHTAGGRGLGHGIRSHVERILCRRVPDFDPNSFAEGEEVFAGGEKLWSSRRRR